MEYYEIIALAIIAIPMLIFSAIKKGFIDYIAKYFQSWFKDRFKGEEINQEFNAINERLVELKTRLNADRVYINQFHNGSTFSNTKSIWKTSRVYEICASGVSFESRNLQNIMAVSVWESITAIFDKKPKKYYQKLTGLVCGEKGCKQPFGVYLYDVDKMSESFSKVLLRNQGVEMFLQIPLIHEDQHIIGVVGIDFFDLVHGEDVDCCYICQKVQEIAYYLNKG